MSVFCFFFSQHIVLSRECPQPCIRKCICRLAGLGEGRRVLTLALYVVLFFSAVGPASGGEGVVLSSHALVAALRAGGYNIYFRHAATDWSQSDDIQQAGDWTSCDPSQVRQLSTEGRATSRAVGDAMRTLGVPVGQVFASPYCRTVETASLMNLGPVKTTTDIMNLRVAEYFGGRGTIVKRTRARLAMPTMPGMNTVLVAHGNVAREATSVYPDEGEGAVFLPDGSGGFAYVGRLSPAQWVALAAEFTGSSE